MDKEQAFDELSVSLQETNSFWIVWNFNDISLSNLSKFKNPLVFLYI